MRIEAFAMGVSAVPHRPLARGGSEWGRELEAARRESAAAMRGISQPAAGVGSIDALLALQRVDEAGDRRRRALQRGALLLDLLEELRLGLLAGEIPKSVVSALARGAAEFEHQRQEPGLEAVLGEIAVRVAVELAKLEVMETAFGAQKAHST